MLTPPNLVRKFFTGAFVIAALYTSATLLANTKQKEPAPRFNAKASTGETFSNASIKGKVVLLEFWTTWCGFCKAEAPFVEKLSREVNAILAEPATKARLAELGASLLPGSPADFGKLVADETEKWGKVIRFAGIKAEESRTG